VLALQPSLLDLTGASLQGLADEGLEHLELAGGAWVEMRRGWVAGGDVLPALAETVPWRAERRPMYDRVVDVPRLLAFYGEGDPLPHPALDAVRAALDDRYQPVLGERLVTAGLCLYRDGRDSVAWHGDTIGRGSREDTIVAIVSLGATRRLALRPATGGPSLPFDLAHGDLLVMGGSCQRTWQHAVPKTARPVGPRISVQFRAPGVR
jgi:alkylated DNA repair dioxygenase AlkB